MNTKVIEVIAKAGELAYRYYKKDRDHYVQLLEPYTVGKFLVDVPDFNCALFQIRNNVLTLKPAGAKHCDGSTLSPDKLGDADFACAYIAHDYWCEMLHVMATDAAFIAAGWTEEGLAKLGDIMFAVQMGTKSKLAAKVYYWFVRTFGGIWRKLGLCVAGLLAVSLLAGCSGCVEIPEDVFETYGTDPVYQVVPAAEVSGE